MFSKIFSFAAARCISDRCLPGESQVIHKVDQRGSMGPGARTQINDRESGRQEDRGSRHKWNHAKEVQQELKQPSFVHHHNKWRCRACVKKKVNEPMARQTFLTRDPTLCAEKFRLSGTLNHESWNSYTQNAWKIKNAQWRHETSRMSMSANSK